jgi:hypothetical protein
MTNTVLVQEQANRRLHGRWLKLGDNTYHRLSRPAWTSDFSTGMQESFNHRMGKKLQRNFFVQTGGLYRKPEKKSRKNVPDSLKK